MDSTIIEIKARFEDPEKIRQILLEKGARFIGKDHQVDTYFNVPHGRLKWREGNIENHLIFYHREDQKGPKKSEVTLFPSDPSSSLKKILSGALGIKVVVDKHREIYFIENVKFHIDTVAGLGNFIEIEAIDGNGSIGAGRLREQCDFFMALFKVAEENLVEKSYSDLLLSKEIPK